jgi:hypothetical protein
MVREVARYARAQAIVVGLAFACGCSDDPAPGNDGKGHGGGDASADEGGTIPIEMGPPWNPSTKLDSSALPPVRGLLDLRGLIHEHSVHSHDACDNEPRDESGNIDEQCFRDFHDGMCQSRHDFVMLTDHGAYFTETEYPEALLYLRPRGDVLIEHNGAPTANRIPCGDRHYVLLAGCESGTMPVGLERHVGDAALRSAVYGARTAEAMQTLREAGAVVLLSHPEELSPDELADTPLDGFEMYNLHANLFLDLGRALAVAPLLSEPDRLMHPDLAIMALVTEDPAYLERWGTVLARGHKRVTTLGTDAHRNALNMDMPDGERVDSYRRLNVWFSNHLLVRPQADGSWDDRDLKEALRSGRLYGVFEFLGYAAGFSFAARAGGTTHEMGSEIPVSAGVTLEVTLPRVRLLDPEGPAPELSARVLRAIEGGFEVVAESSSDLTSTVDHAGAYRAEIRMRPRHLAPYLNDFVGLAEQDFVWIYSNAIYVAE